MPSSRPSSAARVHHFRIQCRWKGSTAGGRDEYDRTHEASAPPAKATLALSSAPAFRGDPARLNAEQLLVISAASCQLLSFLSAAARAGVDVLEYEDNASAEMPEGQGPARITAIRLAPHIRVRTGTTVEKVLALVASAHRSCFVANSLSAAVTVEPVVEVRGEVA